MFYPVMSRGYHSLPLDEESSCRPGGNLEKQTRALPSYDGGSSLCGRARQMGRYWVWLAHAILLSISMTLFALSFCERTARPSDLTVTKEFSSYSPVAPVVKYDTVRYNLTPVVEGPFVGFGPEVDAAWDNITEMGDQMISEEELDRLGLPRNSLKIKHPETGVEGYRAAVEVFHQLHCLNLLRMRIYKPYYINVNGDIQEEEQGLQGHVDHCIETLRINLMCTGDIGIFTFREYPEYGYDEGDFWPDFSTLHTCRNFDAIHRWATDNVVSWTHEV